MSIRETLIFAFVYPEIGEEVSGKTHPDDRQTHKR